MNDVAIIGLGLIGGSIAAGLKQRGYKGRIAAWDQSAAAIESGRTMGLIDDQLEDIAAAAACEFTILCVPVGAMKSVLGELPLGPGVTSDVASVKGDVLASLKSVYGEVPKRFVPGHPIAGSEKHGVDAADPDLFTDHRIILTPTDDTDEAATTIVAEFWQNLGATVTCMSADHHDSILAQTSHLPHLLAYALVDTLSYGGDELEVFEYAAGGFRDFSRIAASDPVMWRDIFLANREQVLDILDRYVEELGSLRSLVASADGENLEGLFKRSKAARDHFAEISNNRK